eukprot:2560335-Prymnesium_polylepis.1
MRRVLQLARHHHPRHPTRPPSPRLLPREKPITRPPWQQRQAAAGAWPPKWAHQSHPIGQQTLGALCANAQPPRHRAPAVHQRVLVILRRSDVSAST